MLTELFSLVVTAEALRAKIDRKSAISLQCGQWTDLSTVLSQCTRVTDGRTDGRTDGQTEFSSLDCKITGQKGRSLGHVACI